MTLPERVVYKHAVQTRTTIFGIGPGCKITRVYFTSELTKTPTFSESSIWSCLIPGDIRNNNENISAYLLHEVIASTTYGAFCSIFVSSVERYHQRLNQRSNVNL